MSVAENGRSLALAEELLAVRDAPPGERDLRQIRNLVLDHLGCCYAGSLLAWGRRMHEWAAPHAGSGNAPLLASQTRLAPGLAAFVNATAAHGLELDDTHDESVSHPGAAVIASSLALAAHHGLSGERLAAAILAGYEAVGRVGAATNAAETIELGFHPTSLFVGFGAAAAAAVLLNLSPRELARGWGLVLSMAGGSMQFSQEPEGTTVKRLHGGYAALHGVMAAEHAGLGIAGPEQALEGRYGLISNFGAQSDPERLNLPHPDGPEIHRISYKPYPCCRLFHSTLDALAEVTGDFSLDPEEIESHRRGRSRHHGHPAHAAPADLGDGRAIQPAVHARRGALLRPGLGGRFPGRGARGPPHAGDRRPRRRRWRTRTCRRPSRRTSEAGWN